MLPKIYIVWSQKLKQIIVQAGDILILAKLEWQKYSDIVVFEPKNNDRENWNWENVSDDNKTSEFISILCEHFSFFLFPHSLWISSTVFLQYPL